MSTANTAAASSAPAGATTWRFSREFWIANVIELFERAAYYGTFIALALFLSSVVGFSDVEAGYIGAIFSASIYFLPFLTGAAADRMGFRAGLVLAFALLTVGYAALGLFPTKLSVPFILAVIAVGGGFVKPIITGTAAKASTEANRARAYSLFYMMVNIGSFSGKTIAKPVRVALGVGSIPLYSAGAALIALILVVLFYHPAARKEGEAARSAKAALAGIATVLKNGRFLALILITSGFWAIQGQLYASMPKYVLRTVGEAASPEWYANVNPFVVVLCVVPITQLVRRLQPITSIAIALALIPFSALTMSLSPLLSGAEIGGLHPVTLVMIVGIAIQGLAECFLSPRYLEFASRLAPPGEEGLYLGYAHLNTFFAWFFGFILSGYLLDAFCPDPKNFANADAATRAAAYAHAHYIWYVFAGIGATAFVLLLVFQASERMRSRRAS